MANNPGDKDKFDSLTAPSFAPKKVYLGDGFPLEEGNADFVHTYTDTDEASHLHVIGVNPARISLSGGDDKLINDNPLLKISAGDGDDTLRTVPVPYIDGGAGKDVVVYRITDPAKAKFFEPFAEKLAEEFHEISKATVRGVEKVYYDTGDGKAKTFGIVLSEIMPSKEDLSFLKPSLNKIGDLSKSVLGWIK